MVVRPVLCLWDVNIEVPGRGPADWDGSDVVVMEDRPLINLKTEAKMAFPLLTYNI